MPTYDYQCSKCELIEEIQHSIHKDPMFKCPKCKHKMERLISGGMQIITSGIKPTLADSKETEHNKKVKDPERAVRARKKAFGTDAVGDPSMSTDPRHVVRRGRTLGGQQKDIDKREFIKAAAKDPLMVKKAQDALKKNGSKSGN